MPGLSPRELSRSPSANAEGRILYICGSMNQTTQMHKVAQELKILRPGFTHSFTPYYVDEPLETMRKWKWLNFTIAGDRSIGRVFEYLKRNELDIDFQGKRGPYQLVLTCADLVVPRNIRNSPIVLVQEGMTDPEHWAYHIARNVPLIPRWFSGTSMMGLSGQMTRFCVASEAYRQLFIRKGVPAEQLVVTGIPNFDDLSKHLNNDFPLRDYFLVCTSDLRETFIPENRKLFIEKAVRCANGRRLVFKLHPNENLERAKREIEKYAPDSLIYTSGNTDEMIANCSGFLTHYSTTVYVALVLGKEVHCDLDVNELKRLLPLQNRSAAKNIARVCQNVLAETSREGSLSTISISFARHPLQWVRAFYRGIRTIS